MAGYSGTPLGKKLGIKEGSVVALVNAPKGFMKELEPLPATVRIVTRTAKAATVIVFFATSEALMRRNFLKLAAKIYPNGMLWLAWPKKTSGVSTDLTFANVQRLGLNAGLVDVKICALNETWSGLKFVFRLKDR